MVVGQGVADETFEYKKLKLLFQLPPLPTPLDCPPPLSNRTKAVDGDSLAACLI
jgi:hypothetical protein